MKLYLDTLYVPPAPQRTAPNTHAPTALDPTQASHDEGSSAFANLLTQAKRRHTQEEQSANNPVTSRAEDYTGDERRKTPARRNENLPALLDTRSLADRRRRQHLDLKI